MRLLGSLILLPLLVLLAADANLAGKYTGEWKSNGAGGGGAFRMNLDSGSDGAWKCDISFDFGGGEVKTTIKTCAVDGSKLDASYDFELQGTMLRSTITGEWNGKAFAGRCSTTNTDGGDAVDEGSWTATPAK